jgi:two-component system, LytTR family, response regulator AlgR
MRCVIVDDEALARERLRSLVEEVAGLEVCGEAANGRDALLQCETLRPDLVFLDIRMPVMDGLEAARHLASAERPPAVIFTTAYGEHALEAFETHALDYLLKPVRRERLVQALGRVRRITQGASVALAGLPEAQVRSHICARVRGALQVMPVAGIRYFQADSKYVIARDADQSLLIEDSLKALEEEFADRFLRIHRNALVASAYVKALEKDAEGRCLVVLEGVEEKLEVSRRHAPELRRWLRGGVSG